MILKEEIERRNAKEIKSIRREALELLYRGRRISGRHLSYLAE